jgi:hypothetical protein
MWLGAMPLSTMEKWFVAHNNNNNIIIIIIIIINDMLMVKRAYLFFAFLSSSKKQHKVYGLTLKMSKLPKLVFTLYECHKWG